MTRSHQSSAGSTQWVVPLSDVRVDRELREAVQAVVDSGWWSMGARVEAFERAFAEFCGVRHALGVANGTAALHLALLAAGCGPGDEVVLPSLNFVAAANAIVHTGATPVFCDVLGEQDLNLDPDDVEAAIGPATKAVLPLHYGGYACDMHAVSRLAERYDLRIVEDAAVGEGGMLVTNDDVLADRLRLLRSHGMTALTWDRHRGHAHSYDVVEHGFNYRLDEIRAAMGLVQLRRLTEENAARARISASYRTALDGRQGVSMPFGGAETDTSSHHLAVVLLPGGLPRNDVRTALAEAGVQSSMHYPPIHQFSRFAELGSRRPLPRTEAVAERLLTLPLHGGMSDDDVEHVVTSLLATLR